jgi:HAMP domain-containing protein
LNVGFLIACFLPLILATSYAVYYYNGKIHQEAIARINSDLKVAELIYQSELGNLRNLAIYHASVPSLKFLLNSVFTMGYNFENQLKKQLGRFVYENDLTSAVVLTLNFERFPRKARIYEGYALRALNEDVSAGIERTPQGSLTFVAAAPVYNKSNDIIGASVLTRRFLEAGILDNIQRETGANAYFIATEPELAPGTKTNLQSPKYSLTAISKAFGIKNSQGESIGSLVVWRSTKEYDKARYTAILVFLLIGIGGIVLAALLRHMITRTIVSPIYLLRKATDFIETGNFDTRVKLSGYDEIGKLGQHFNSMAEKIEKSFVSQKLEIEAKTTEIQMKNKELAIVLGQLDAIQEIVDQQSPTQESTVQIALPTSAPEEPQQRTAVVITAENASEFRNSLNSICSFTQILVDFVNDLKAELAQEHPRQEALEHIFQELPRLARTVHQQGCYAGQLLRRLLGVNGNGDGDGNGDHDLAFTVMLPASEAQSKAQSELEPQNL